jgi:hypothetical protein
VVTAAVAFKRQFAGRVVFEEHVGHDCSCLAPIVAVTPPSLIETTGRRNVGPSDPGAPQEQTFGGGDEFFASSSWRWRTRPLGNISVL